ncbi:MAG: cupin domain-containing protein [Burkholderiales bacterium]
MLAVIGTLVVVACVELIWSMPGYVDYREKLATRERHELHPLTVDSSWIISGSPVFRANVFQHSRHAATLSGIWECVGPAKFEWRYGVDESIYVLEGSVEIEYLGRKIRLVAGDSAHFAAGTTAVWTVTDHVKKTYYINRPGLLMRAIRRVFPLDSRPAARSAALATLPLAEVGAPATVGE